MSSTRSEAELEALREDLTDRYTHLKLKDNDKEGAKEWLYDFATYRDQVNALLVEEGGRPRTFPTFSRCAKNLMDSFNIDDNGTDIVSHASAEEPPRTATSNASK